MLNNEIYHNQNILVTGGAGAIGSNLSRSLAVAHIVQVES